MPSVVSKGRGGTSGGMPIDPSQMKGIDPDAGAASTADPNIPAHEQIHSTDDSDSSDPNSFQSRIKKVLAGGAKGSQQPIDDDLLRRTMGAAAQRGQMY